MTLIDRMNANYISQVTLSEIEDTFDFMTILNARDVEEVRRELDESKNTD